MHLPFGFESSSRWKNIAELLSIYKQHLSLIVCVYCVCNWVNVIVVLCYNCYLGLVSASKFIVSWRNDAVAEWLRHCNTNRKTTGSIPECTIWIFHWHKPSSRDMALRLTHPLYCWPVHNCAIRDSTKWN
jgi:hypothetical protein